MSVVCSPRSALQEICRVQSAQHSRLRLVVGHRGLAGAQPGQRLSGAASSSSLGRHGARGLLGRLVLRVELLVQPVDDILVGFNDFLQLLNLASLLLLRPLLLSLPGVQLLDGLLALPELLPALPQLPVPL